VGTKAALLKDPFCYSSQVEKGTAEKDGLFQEEKWNGMYVFLTGENSHLIVILSGIWRVEQEDEQT
jgi:hypothetical protein